MYACVEREEPGDEASHAQSTAWCKVNLDLWPIVEMQVSGFGINAMGFRCPQATNGEGLPVLRTLKTTGDGQINR